MIELVAQNPLLRMLLLVLLFAIVAATAYFVAQSVALRQATRRRLVDGSSAAPARADAWVAAHRAGRKRLAQAGQLDRAGAA